MPGRKPAHTPARSSPSAVLTAGRQALSRRQAPPLAPASSTNSFACPSHILNSSINRSVRTGLPHPQWPATAPEDDRDHAYLPGHPLGIHQPRRVQADVRTLTATMMARSWSCSNRPRTCALTWIDISEPERTVPQATAHDSRVDPPVKTSGSARELLGASKARHLLSTSRQSVSTETQARG